MTAKPFEIYDNLLHEINTTTSGGSSISDVGKLSNILNGLPREHSEIVFALIYHHSLVENKGVTFQKTPYSGMPVHGGKGIIYKIHNLPPRLISIISAYVKAIPTTK